MKNKASMQKLKTMQEKRLRWGSLFFVKKEIKWKDNALSNFQTGRRQKDEV